MDLVMAIRTSIQTEDSAMLMERMSDVQKAAVQRVDEAAKAYVDLVEGRSGSPDCKSLKDLQNADIGKIVLAVAADAGHDISGLRDSLDEVQSCTGGLSPTLGASHQVDKVIDPLMDQVMVIASIWAMATNPQLDLATQQRYRKRVTKDQEHLRSMLQAAIRTPG